MPPTPTQKNIEPNYFEIESGLNIVSSAGGSMMKGGAMQSPNFAKGSSGGWKIDAEGNAIFQSVTVGQYTIVDNGIASFGDGSDGSLATSGNVTLTEDKYYTDLTISDGDTFNPAGYRIFVNGTLTVGEGVSGIISRNGNDGGDAGDGDSPGAGGAALADGYLKGSVAGGNGGTSINGTGAGNPGAAGDATSNSIGSDGVLSGAGGASGGGQGGGVSGAVGSATASNAKLVASWHLSTMLDITSSGSTVKFNNSAGAGGAGAGGSDSGAIRGGSGAGAGSSGGIVAIYARSIVVSSGGTIQVNGGAGGVGGDGSGGATGGGGGGGGGGGNGGQMVLVYNTYTNNGTVEASGGAGGAGGSGGGGAPAGSNGATGTTGTAGTIRQFNISL